MGAEKCLRIKPEKDITSARLRQQETTEMLSLLDLPSPFPTLRFQDLQPVIKQAQKGAILEARELGEISRVIALLNSVRKYLGAQEPQVTTLLTIIDGMDNLSSVGMSIDRCINEEGEILDSASIALHKAIKEAKSLKQHMRKRLEAMIVSEKYCDILQEPYFEIRESRYVLPVKVERQHSLPGIVHDASASGATVFMEPRELIELNNQIKVADLQVTREINRILLELSALVGLHAKVFQGYLEVLSYLDSIVAKARLSKLMKGHPVEITSHGCIHIYQARHPLLFLAKQDVVPNDLFLEENDRVLVISGPNTGGKTVILKLLGLFAFMLQTGLHLSCAEGSRMGFFTHIFADIGDAQDLRKDLSSFSAHMVNLVKLFETVRSDPQITHQQCLVLLDEVVSSTDPSEGAALAEALLMQMASLGLKVVVTTHYNALKVLALSTPGFVNASLEISMPSLVPTYRFIQGLPGGSSALDIAAGLGLDKQVLEHARTLLNQEDRKMEDLLAKLQELHAQLNQELAKAREDRLIAEQAASEASSLAEKLRNSEREAMKTFKKRFREELVSARQEIQETLEQLHKNRTVDKAQKSLKRLSSLSKQVVNEQESSGREVPIETLNMGDCVEIASLETTGILLDSPNGQKRVRIRVGDSEISVATDLLQGKEKIKHSQEGASSSRRTKKKSLESESSPQNQSGSEFFTAMTIDVRGQTAEDALDHITAMLDQAALKQFKGIRIIHGHGTGKLKQVTREYVAQSPYILTYRSGSVSEGGDGVTMVELG